MRNINDQNCKCRHRWTFLIATSWFTNAFEKQTELDSRFLINPQWRPMISRFDSLVARKQCVVGRDIITSASTLFIAIYALMLSNGVPNSMYS